MNAREHAEMADHLLRTSIVEDDNHEQLAFSQRAAEVHALVAIALEMTGPQRPDQRPYPHPEVTV